MFSSDSKGKLSIDGETASPRQVEKKRRKNFSRPNNQRHRAKKRWEANRVLTGWVSPRVEVKKRR